MFNFASNMSIRGFKSFCKDNSGFVSLVSVFAIFLLISPYFLFIDVVFSAARKLVEFTLYINGLHIVFIFLIFFVIYLLFTVPIFLNGLSVYGYIISYIYTAMMAFCIAIFIGCFYSVHGLMGLKYCMAIIIPSVFVFITSFLLACRESLVFSRMMGRLFSADGSYNYHSDFKLYCLRFLVLVGLIAAAALVATACSYFIKIF